MNDNYYFEFVVFFKHSFGNASLTVFTFKDVIRCLLKKFKVADNPHKYALYERSDDTRRDR